MNLGNPREFTMLELAEKVIGLTGSRSKIVHKPLPTDDPKQRRPDITLARKKLGWEPGVELEEGLRRTIDYFKTCCGPRSHQSGERIAEGGPREIAALITGITGQDGAYLAEFLLRKGYEVHGIKRRASLFNTDRIDHLYQDPHEAGVRFILHYGDLTDATNLIRIIQQVQPDEIYNLAAQSHVAVSFETPGVHGQRGRAGHAAAAGGDPHPGTGEEDPLLPGLHLRDVRQGAGGAADARRRRSIRARPTGRPSSTPTGSR